MSRKLGRVLTIIISVVLWIEMQMVVLAAPSSTDEALAEAEERKLLPVQSNEIADWPEGPAIGAEAAIILEANTGVVLYEKNIHERLYPASTTKLMTCLVAAEHSSMNEMVTFTHSAVFSIESGSSNIGMDAGQAMPMEECLYGILSASANEVAAAVAEHVGGSQEAFVDMMNEKAKELGLTDTHFMNPHGLFHEEHYTSAYDLAIIAKAFFQNELLSKIGNTPTHHFVATEDQPDDFVVKNKHQLITGEIPYEGIKGGKTGYTDEARQTLVTCAEKNGMKLICVILKEESPEQFYDTVKLFDYGFQNFGVANVSENEDKYNIENTGFFHTSYDIFGNSKPLLSLNKDSYLILPGTATFQDLTSQIVYHTESDMIAEIQYFFHDAYVGTAAIEFHDQAKQQTAILATMEAEQKAQEAAANEKQVIVINVRKVILITVMVAGILILLIVIRDIVVNYAFIGKPKTKKTRLRGRRRKRF